MTKAPRSFVARATMTYGSNVGASVLSLVNVLIIARGLDATGRGQIAFLTTIAMLTSQLATLGLQEANTTFSGRRPALVGALATNSLILAVLSGLLAAGAVAVIIAIFPSVGGDVPAGLRWLSLGMIPLLILGTAIGGLAVAQYGHGAFNAAWLVTPALCVLGNGALLAAGQLTVGRALGLWCVGQAISAAILVWYVARRLAGFARPDPRLAWRALRFGVAAHAARVLYQGNYRGDQWILGAVVGSHALGIYSVAVAWSEALFFLPTALTLALLPDVTRASPGEAGRQAAAVLRPTMIITGVMALGMIVLAPLLVTTLFGHQFAPATGQLRVLALGSFGIVALKLLGETLTAQARPLLETAGVAATFVFVVGLDFLLIPDHGGMGASIASLVGYTAGGLAIAAIFTRTLGVRARELLPRGNEVLELRRLLRRKREATPA